MSFTLFVRVLRFLAHPSYFARLDGVITLLNVGGAMMLKHLPMLLFVSVCLIWGTTWLAMEIAVQTIPPIFSTGLRFVIAAPLLILLAKLLKQPLFFPKEKMVWMPIVAIFYFAVPFTLMIFGEQYISSGLASVIFANMPIAVMITSSLFSVLDYVKCK